MKRYTYLTALVLLAGLGACTKEAVSTSGKNPYEETVLPAIYINKDGITPANGHVGEEVVISGKGFEKNKDKLSILFNGVKAAVISLTDTTVRVKVPTQAATGNVAAQVDQQYFFGPFFRVLGVFEMDTLFPGKVGANEIINDIIPVDNGKYLIVGNFTDYNAAGTKPGRVARLNHDGTMDGSFGTDAKNGTNTAVYTAAVVPGSSNKYLVAGAFNNYQGVSYVNSIALLNNNGSLAADKIFSPSAKDITVSALKGGVSGTVASMKVQADGKILLAGLFRFYVQPNFNLTSSLGLDSVHLDSIQVNGLVRLMPDGSLDSTYNYDLAKHMGKEGPNGYIYQSILLPDGKLLIAGSFTRYNGQAVNRIARLNTDGSLDPSFTVGAGADQLVENMAMQADGKVVLVGNFNNYGGVSAPHIARINANGVLDPTFNVGKGSDGYVHDISFMPGGQIILSGSFSQFGDLKRNNMIVLNADGSVHPTYNSNGGFKINLSARNWGIMKIVQQAGEKSMLVVGSFTEFDYRGANRIARITYP
ncbi:IPT/TIG domain-containing protein [Chitinophaga sp.]|uniref:IPT/TIG domain-containing protein n=1 Tax=Chitinophaga sp. TaxID=1869181 RepID=UPI002F93B605